MENPESRSTTDETRRTDCKKIICKLLIFICSLSSTTTILLRFLTSAQTTSMILHIPEELRLFRYK